MIPSKHGSKITNEILEALPILSRVRTGIGSEQDKKDAASFIKKSLGNMEMNAAIRSLMKKNLGQVKLTIEKIKIFRSYLLYHLRHNTQAFASCVH